ncbi:hypothetical protein M6D81_02415 [Paenibacillus sp. J5C_2022]|uniref:hypothetical protein n=1 Tax=Paenibacillus sp. J5C2022 TaxID=2977129 RepID=UPI0021CF73C4|nr:hypothetical protein [Paenibacillus sp. J5C2022]MCU6707551.1 hypothetical protein [Paenibacillus sp. J5C2022]
MFHPTVFDNLKVAFENELYDLDNLDGRILITGRKDIWDMAVMDREFSVSFRLTGTEWPTAELKLAAPLKELAAEILEQEGAVPACGLHVLFHMDIAEAEAERSCAAIEACLCSIWQPENKPVQTVSSVYGADPAALLRNTAELSFSRRINEEQMEDIPELVAHILATLEGLRSEPSLQP